MKCIFCGSDTDERMSTGKLILIAHQWCIEERKDELDTEDIVECLIFEDRIRFYTG